MPQLQILVKIKNFFSKSLNNKICPEQLSDDKMQKMFKKDYKGLLFYDFDLMTWNRDSYLGYQIHNQMDDTEYLMDMAKMWQYYSPNSKTKPAAIVFMAVDAAHYRGDMRVHVLPDFSPNGTAVVATFVMRDLKNGRLKPVDYFWLGVGNFGRKDIAARGTAMVVAHNFIRSSQWRNVFFDTFSIHGK